MGSEYTTYTRDKKGNILSAEKTVDSGGNVSWGNVITGTLILGIIGFLIVGIPVGTAVGRLFGTGSTIWWSALGIIAFIWLVKRR